MAVINMNSEMFHQAMDQKGTVLVDFWAPWCTYCRRINAAYDQVAAEKEGEMVVAKINIDDEESLAQKEQIEVVPTLVLYRDGQALGFIVAPDSKAKIDRFIQETLSSD